MHELTVTESIFDIVHKHALRNRVARVVTVRLQIGSLSDLETVWLQRYFDRLSRDTVCAGARLAVERIPAVFDCRQCEEPFEINSLPQEDIVCPLCSGREVVLVSGREYRVKDMEAQ